MLNICNLNNEQHKELIDYAFGFCDSISFVVQNYNHSKSNNQNFLKDDSGKEDSDCCLHYQNTKELIKELNLIVSKSDTSSKYGSQKYSYQSKIFFVVPNQKLKKFLSVNSFENWTFPKLPEDIIIYKNHSIWLETISHENIIWIHDESKEDIDFLKAKNISYFKEI
ncbi:MAG: hypothetical protein IKU66_03785 [Clostridia bacterium]|nr:hypothetical protein [Clostridia bacterium]